MKLIGFLLMTIATVLGTIAATTAYLPRVDAALAGENLHLNGPAGLVKTDEGPRPIADRDDVLTAELIAELDAAEVKRVRVKEFSFERWTHLPHFIGAVVLMIAGAMTVRFATKAEIKASSAGEEGEKVGPRRLLDQIDQEVAATRRALEDVFDEEARCVVIVDRIGQLQSEQIAQFFDVRPQIVGRLGLARYAGVMDRFSALERTLNRAWSAAADGHEPEAMACLDKAAALVPEVRERLAG